MSCFTVSDVQCTFTCNMRWWVEVDKVVHYSNCGLCHRCCQQTVAVTLMDLCLQWLFCIPCGLMYLVSYVCGNTLPTWRIIYLSLTPISWENTLKLDFFTLLCIISFIYFLLMAHTSQPVTYFYLSVYDNRTSIFSICLWETEWRLGYVIINTQQSWTWGTWWWDRR